MVSALSKLVLRLGKSEKEEERRERGKKRKKKKKTAKTIFSLVSVVRTHMNVPHPLNPQPRPWRSGIYTRLEPVNRRPKSRVGSNPREALF